MEEKEKINQIRKELSKELNERNELISKARNFHYDKRITFSRDYVSYLIKLGELSFLIGAAITPIIIASWDEIPNPKFILYAIIIYLFNGIIAIWNAKSIIETQLDSFAPGNFHILEKNIYPLQFLANKILVDSSKENINKYFELKRDFIVNNAEEKVSSSINMLLDIVVFLFVLASLLTVRVIWTFSFVSYWHFFGISLFAILLLIVFGTIKTKLKAKRNAQDTIELNEMKKDYAKWWEELFNKVDTDK